MDLYYNVIFYVFFTIFHFTLASPAQIRNNHVSIQNKNNFQNNKNDNSSFVSVDEIISSKEFARRKSSTISVDDKTPKEEVSQKVLEDNLKNLTETMEKNRKQDDEVFRFLAAKVQAVPGTIVPALIWNETISKIICTTDSNCDIVPHSNCVRGICQCLVNYRLSEASQEDTLVHCESASCSTSDECKDWDSNMVCSSGLHTCTCAADYIYNKTDRKCNSLGWGVSWILLVSIAAPVVVILLFCLSCYRLARTTIKIR